jgi:hypothetical protein
MKTVSLRTLVREPLKVKRMTRSGDTVQVTDNGDPLWILKAAVRSEDKAQRRIEIEREFAEVLSSKTKGTPLSRIVIESRR